MPAKSPAKIMELLESAVAAWRDFAPDGTFGGKKMNDLQAATSESQDVRNEIIDAENKLKELYVKREQKDNAALIIRELLVNGVIGDPTFGPNSAFYEALGYIRKSDRKSGLTRKKGVSEKS